ncbi:hypothetical protein F4824DRAFT_453494, partial [Ustulina deusta]
RVSSRSRYHNRFVMLLLTFAPRRLSTEPARHGTHSTPRQTKGGEAENMPSCRPCELPECLISFTGDVARGIGES